MLAFKQSIMAQSIKNIPRLIIVYLALNKIGDDGCWHLSKAQWLNLQYISLGKNYSKYLE